jgi:O-antigen ligase
MKINKNKIEVIFPISIILISVIINPINSYDAFNVPKFAALVVVSAILLLLFLTHINIFKFYKYYRFISLIITLFISISVLILIFAPLPITQQLFGIDGRYTGFIFFVALLVLFVWAIIYEYTTKVSRLIYAFCIVGFLSLIYGLIQAYGLDPINWQNPYNRSIGFFGNPNFQSSFLGIFSSIIWAYFFSSSSSYKIKVSLAAVNILTLFAIVKTSSVQGLIIFTSGFLISLLFIILSNQKLRRLFLPFLLINLSLAVIFILDIFQKVPWKSFFYQNSVSERGDLWRAAIKISQDHPLFGVGYDGFDYYYRTYRDNVAAIRQGVGTSSNSAHNIFLDILVNGGIPLLITYIAIILFVLFSAIRIMRNTKSYDPHTTALIAAWTGYQLQSLISVNTIGLSIWGWVLGGAIIGLRLRIVDNSIDFYNHSEARHKPVKFYPTILIGLILGSTIGRAPLATDISFRNSLESRKIELVKAAAYKWPQSPEKMYQIATIFSKNELSELAKTVATDAVRTFPRSFENWELLYSLQPDNSSEKSRILSRMKELDPLNPIYNK